MPGYRVAIGPTYNDVRWTTKPLLCFILSRSGCQNISPGGRRWTARFNFLSDGWELHVSMAFSRKFLPRPAIRVRQRQRQRQSLNPPDKAHGRPEHDASTDHPFRGPHN